MLPVQITSPRAPLRSALVLLAVSASLAAVVEAVLAARAVSENDVLVASYPLVGAGFVLVGAVASDRRRSNPSGGLLSVTGVLILLTALADDRLPDLVTRVSVLLGETPIAALLHVVLAFPSGRVAARLDRALVLALYALVLVRQLPVALPGPDLEPLRLTCSLLGAAVIVVAVARLALRLRREPRGTRQRRVLTLVYAYGGGLLLFFPLSARVLVPVLDLNGSTLTAIQVAGLAVMPPVLAAGVLRGGFVRTGELDELASWLGSQATDESALRDVLAHVLGDPSLQVHVDGAPSDRSGRGVVGVRASDGHETGVAISYDPLIYTDPSPVEEAGRVMAVALERERLRGDLLAEREALRASRARVVEVGDQQRRALAQDLHDLVQTRLTLAALHVGRLAATSQDEETLAGLDELSTQLDELITEFRGVVHGVMPALLLERGLAAAAEDLVDRLPIRAHLELSGADQLPPGVATNAYFILAEALTNAVRHSRACELHVEVAERGAQLQLVVADDGVGGARPTGAGLRGIADRVEALGGHLSLASPVGGGTRLEVVIPCGS